MIELRTAYWRNQVQHTAEIKYRAQLKARTYQQVAAATHQVSTTWSRPEIYRIYLKSTWTLPEVYLKSVPKTNAPLRSGPKLGLQRIDLSNQTIGASHTRPNVCITARLIRH